MPRRSHSGLTLTASDIQTIEEGAKTLPGNWYLDSVIDLRWPRKPRVWVRVVDDSLPPISFERVGSIIWVSMVSEGSTTAGQPFGSIGAAFIYLWARLATLAAETSTSAAYGPNGMAIG